MGGYLIGDDTYTHILLIGQRQMLFGGDITEHGRTQPTYLCRADKAPEGSALRCQDCKVRANCPFDAEKIYITDEATAEAAEILRLLGIVSGTGSGNFEPGRTLTRAEFCKMAVEIMGNGDKVAAQMNRTVFADVPSTPWARGYVAVATQGSSSGSGESAVSTPGIIRGDATGRFHPDRAITGAEAVTILMRILGYHDANVGVGAVWYDGYFSTARSIGLTDGLTLNPTGSITRGQAAILFENLLFTKSKAATTCTSPP